MNRVDRYVFREVLAPTVVAVLAYTGFMLLRAVVQFSDLIVQSDSPLAETGRIIALSTPHIAVLTIPVAFLLGVLIGVGRLGADSELVALRASGIDLLRLYRPIGALAVLASSGTLLLMLQLVPSANAHIYDMKLRLSTFGITQRIQPGVFSPEVAGRRIYVEDASPDRQSLSGLIVADRSNPDEELLTLARRGNLELDENLGQLWLRLEDAVTHRVARDPREYERSSIGTQRVLLLDVKPRGPFEPEKPARAQTLTELQARTRSSLSPIERRVAWVEIHKKFALPAACLVFGLLGLPLGIVNRRGGRAAGFAVSVAIVLGYYVLYAAGEARAIEGTTSPFLAMWLPNLLLLGLALLALARVRRDRPLLPALPSWRNARRAPSTKLPNERRTGMPPLSLRSGPVSLLDRYVASRFLRVFTLVVLSFLVLYVVIDYMEISDDIAKNHPPSAVILGYYRALLFPILLDVVPFAFLVGALIATASLVRSSETTAMLAHGISLLRAVASLLVLSAVTGFLLWFFAERMVPEQAAEADRLRNQILKHPDVVTQRGWLRGAGGRFFSVETYDATSRLAIGFSLVELRPGTFDLARRTYASRAEILPGRGLVLDDGWNRTFEPTGEMLFARREGKEFLEAPEAARFLLLGRTDPRQMTARDLRLFIEARRSAGADVAALATGLYAKSANAFAALLLTLLGLPFAFRFGRRGAVAGVGVALLLGIAYLFIAQGLLGNAGETGALSPLLAAWGGNVLFGLAAIYGLLGVRT